MVYAPPPSDTPLVGEEALAFADKHYRRRFGEVYTGTVYHVVRGLGEEAVETLLITPEAQLFMEVYPELILNTLPLLGHQEALEEMAAGDLFEAITYVYAEEMEGAEVLLARLEQRLWESLGSEEDFLGAFSPRFIATLQLFYPEENQVSEFSLKEFLDSLLTFAALGERATMYELYQLSTVVALPQERFILGVELHLQRILDGTAGPFDVQDSYELRKFLTILFQKRLQEAWGFFRGHALLQEFGMLANGEHLTIPEALIFLRDIKAYEELPVSWWLPLVREAATQEQKAQVLEEEG